MFCVNCSKLAILYTKKVCVRCQGTILNTVSCICDKCSDQEKLCSVCLKKVYNNPADALNKNVFRGTCKACGK